MLTQNMKLMRNLLIGAAVATTVVAVTPAFAGPAEEAAGDYAGWRAAEKAMAEQQAATQHSHVILRSNHVGEAR
jgi:hypothetical protein